MTCVPFPSEEVKPPQAFWHFEGAPVLLSLEWKLKTKLRSQRLSEVTTSSQRCTVDYKD